MNPPTYLNSENLIIKIFSALNDMNIPYVVLRNYEGLPGDVGHDIDLLVDENNIDNFKKIFIKTILLYEWSIVQNQSRFGFFSYIIISPKLSDLKIESLKWDIWAPITWIGIPWINSDTILANRKLHSNLFYIPSSGAESASLIIKDLIHGKSIKKKYFEKIKRLCIKDPDNFSAVLLSFFGNSYVTTLKRWVIVEEWQKIQNSAPFLKRTLIKRSILKHPYNTFAGFIRFIIGHTCDYIRGRNRIIVSFLGPDGSGKSTISLNVMEASNDIFEDVRYYHGQFGYFPRLSIFLPENKNKDATEEKQDNNIIRPLGKLPSAIMIIYYSIEYLFGLLLIKIQRRKCDLVVFDRNYYDYVIQPGPFTMDSLLFKTLLLLMPKPDITVFLNSPANVIFKRKPELNVQEISRQQMICEQIIYNNSNSWIVDNTLPKEIVVQTIRSKIIEQIRKNAMVKYGR